ncbi:MAG TPA: hypothetical protein VGK31_06005 [Thermoanaerobaculia bacterium]
MSIISMKVFHRLRDPARMVAKLIAEERFADGIEREPQHLVSSVDRVATPPRRSSRSRGFVDDPCILGEARVMKERLQLAALFAVQRLLRGEQSVFHDDPPRCSTGPRR